MLKGPLTPGRKKAEVFGHFGHRPMPHSVVVFISCYDNESTQSICGKYKLIKSILR